VGGQQRLTSRSRRGVAYMGQSGERGRCSRSRATPGAGPVGGGAEAFTAVYARRRFTSRGRRIGPRGLGNSQPRRWRRRSRRGTVRTEAAGPDGSTASRATRSPGTSVAARRTGALARPLPRRHLGPEDYEHRELIDFGRSAGRCEGVRPPVEQREAMTLPGRRAHRGGRGPAVLEEAARPRQPQLTACGRCRAPQTQPEIGR
jgi:hypothetical protein